MTIPDGICTDPSASGAGVPVSIDSLHHLADLISRAQTIELPPQNEPNVLQAFAAENLGMFHWNLLELPFGIDPRILKGLLDNGSYEVSFPEPGFQIGTDLIITRLVFEDGTLDGLEGRTADFFAYAGSFFGGSGWREITDLESWVVAKLAGLGDSLSATPLPNANIHFTSLDSRDLVIPVLDIPGIARIEGLKVTGGSDIIGTGENPFHVATFTLKVPESTIAKITLFPGEFADGNVITDSGARDLEVTFARGANGRYYLQHAGLTLVTGSATLAGGDITSDNAELTLAVTGTENGVLTVNANLLTPQSSGFEATVCADDGVGVTLGAAGVGTSAMTVQATVNTASWSPDLTQWAASYRINAAPTAERISLFNDHVVLEDFSCASSSITGSILPGSTLGEQTLISEDCAGKLVADLLCMPVGVDLGQQRVDVQLTPQAADVAMGIPEPTYKIVASAHSAGLTVTTPHGRATVSDRLNGSIRLVDSAPGAAFAPRVVAGSVAMHDSGAQQVDTATGSLTATSDLDLTSDAQGGITLTTKTRSSLPVVGDVDLNSALNLTGIAVDRTAAGTPFYATPSTNYQLTASTQGQAGITTEIDQSVRATVDASQSGELRLDAALEPTHVVVKTPQGPLVITTQGGGVTGTLSHGDLSRDSVLQLSPPAQIRLVQTISQGGEEIVVETTLTPSGAIQARVNLPASTLALNTAENAGLSGLAIIKRRDPASGALVAVGEIAVESHYTLTGNTHGGVFVATLAIPETGLSGRVTRDIVLKNGILPAGAKFSLPITGFKGEITLDPQALAVRSRWTAADLGMTADIPPQALAAAFPDLQEPLHVELTGQAHGQQYDLDVDLTHGVRFAGVTEEGGRLAAFDANLSLQAGEGLQLNANSSSGLADVTASYDITSGDLKIGMDGVALAAAVKDSLVNLAGAVISLDDINTETVLRSLSAVVDTRTGTLTLSVTPYDVAKSAPMPTGLAAWLAWNRQDWEHYRAGLTDPQVRHLATVNGLEGILHLLPPEIPRGHGTLYVDLTEPLQVALPLSTLSDPNALQAHLTELSTQIMGSLRYTWSEPNPPSREGSPTRAGSVARGESTNSPSGEALVYSPTHDALFIVDPTDTKVPTFLAEALGLDPIQAMILYKSGRVDLSMFTADSFLAQIFTPETLRKLTVHYLAGSDGDFTRGSHRFLLALADIRREYVAMTEPVAMARGPEARAFAVRSFADPTYQGIQPEAVAATDENDGLNATYTVYLPNTSPMEYLELVGKVEDWGRWRPRFSATRRNGDGDYTGRFLHRDFTMTTWSVSDPDLSTFSYREVPGRGEFERFAGESLILPTRDSGIVVIDQVAVNARGDDRTLYRGQYDPLPTADASDKRLIDQLIKLLANLKSPKTDPTVVHPVVQNLSYSNAVRQLSSEGSRSPPSAVFPLRQNLVTRPGMAVITAALGEFLFLSEADTAATGASASLASSVDASHPPALILRTDAGSRVRAKGLLEYAGFQASEAEQILDSGSLSFEALAQLPVIKDIMTAAEIQGLARAMLVNSPHWKDELLLGHSDRLLYTLGDIRTRFARWTLDTRLLDARSFDGRYHGYSDTNRRDYTDTMDCITGFVFPPGLDFGELVDVFSKPEEFHKYSKDYDPDGCRAQDNGDGTKTVDWKITLIGSYQLRVPSKLTPEGNVCLAPWTAHGTKGFDENEGAWIFVRLKDGQILAIRTGLLNAATPGDMSFAGTGLTAVAGLLGGVYEAKTGLKLDVKFGEVTAT